MKRFLPFAIIVGVLLLALGSGTVFYRTQNHVMTGSSATTGNPGAEPAHVRGSHAAPAALEEFGDFECLPCFVLWPALRNLETEFGHRLSVTFRECPLPQHSAALSAARAAEAAGLQGQFWEMHDMLYLSRSQWVHGGDIQGVFDRFAARLRLNIARFDKDMDGKEVARRIAADHARAVSLGIDRTPVVFLNGQRLQIRNPVAEDLRKDINAVLAKQSR
ncbi:MAG TPA: thioredoxin domain-containing protein [Chthoniobacterales bacterium]